LLKQNISSGNFNSPVSFPELPLGPLYEAMRAKFRWNAAEIRGRAIESGEMTHGLLDPNSAEPKHVRTAIKRLQHQLSRNVGALLKNWNPNKPTDLERPQ
jgi:hypothetical protein